MNRSRYDGPKEQKEKLLKVIYNAAKGNGDQPDISRNVLYSNIKLESDFNSDADLHAALLILQKDGLVNYTPNESLTITRKGVTRVESAKKASQS